MAEKLSGNAAYQVSQAIDIVKAGVAGRSNDIIQVIAWQAEVWDLLEAAVHMLQMDPIVLLNNDISHSKLGQSKEWLMQA